MPTPSEISVETKANTDIQNETNSVDTNLEAQDMQQKKKQLNQSPRRKNNSNRSLNMQPNRRNQGYHSKKSTNDNNKQSVYKQSNQQKQSNNLNPMSNGQQQSQDSSKKSSQRAYRTPSMYNKNHNGNVHYDLHADTTSAPPSLDNDFLIQQQIHSPGDHDVPRKYSKNFLHEVGYKLTSPKQVEEMAMRMALGDNSAYFGHYFARQLYGTQTQMMIQQQQQQQQFYQSLPRYATTQHLQLQRLQHRNQQGSYNNNNNKSPSLFEQDIPTLPCHCPQAPIQQQRSMQYTYQNSPTYLNQNKRDFRSDKQKRHYGYQNNNNQRSYIEKSQSFNEEDLRNKNYTQNENHTFRSLSPTPPSSSKSSSPGVHEKCLDVIDDTESTASGTSSVQGYYNEGTKSPSENIISSSAPVLGAPDFQTKRTNHWIDSQKIENKLYNGYSSLSADEINNFPRDYNTFKRPQSVNANKRVQILKHLPYEAPDPVDMYIKHAESSEIRETPPNLFCRSKFDSLSEQMWNKFLTNQQSQITYKEKIEIWFDLCNSLRNLPLFHQLAYPKWGLFMVGSTISGFGSDRSDVDMCFVIKGPDTRHDPRTEAIMTLNDLKSHLTLTRSPFINYSLINAKVPILRFHNTTNKIEVDLNYNNCVGVRNTHLLCHYSQLDWRIRPLALVVKLWAQFHNINDARNSTISSYSLVLMVIHFLQYAVKPAVLPCLHKIMPEKFNHLHDITTINMVEQCEINWKSENTQPLGELFLRFLDYYTNFDYSKNAISIRTGGVLNIEDCKMVKNPKNDPNHWQTLCIEEPFDLTNTARSAYDAEVFKKIRDVFMYSFFKLNEDRKLESVFTAPLFTQQEQQKMSQLKYLNMNGSMNGHGPTLSLPTDVKS